MLYAAESRVRYSLRNVKISLCKFSKTLFGFVGDVSEGDEVIELLQKLLDEVLMQLVRSIDVVYIDEP